MKIALGIEYDGCQYFGWQRQESVLSVQQKLEEALSVIANSQIEVFCAGRTDSGVHGTGQVVHFETEVQRPLESWCFGTNARTVFPIITVTLITKKCTKLGNFYWVKMIFRLSVQPNVSHIRLGEIFIISMYLEWEIILSWIFKRMLLCIIWCVILWAV